MRGKFGLVFGVALANLLWLLSANTPGETQSQPKGSVPIERSQQVVKALGILVQVVRNVETYVNTKELGSIHNEDMMLYSGLTLLLEDNKQAPEDRKEAQGVTLSTFGKQVSDLHEAADANNQSEAEARLRIVLKTFEDLKKFYDADLFSKADKLANHYTCPMHPDINGTRTDLCPKCGMGLDQNIRINLFSSGQTIVLPTTMKASIQTLGPLTQGSESSFYLRLRKIIDDSPILPTDLREVHTQKIHLFLIDRSLEDYHHVHPKPTDTPGSYSFVFKPQKKGSYRAWVDVRSTLTGFQEYVMTEIPSEIDGEPLSDKSLKLDAAGDGLKYHLSFNSKEIQVGQPVLAKVVVKTVDEKPFTELEPVMGTFAHIAGFNEDYQTVLHMHPKGNKLLTSTDRGGPELEFLLYATKPGFYRLFAQVQVEGNSRYAPFGISVVP